MERAKILTPYDHDRDSAGMTYVYPVVSRRAGGVSVGVNLNPNNACNWRCLYCQVPNLKRGGPPAIDLRRLEEELRRMLEAIVHGDFLARHVPESARRLNDIALSGNGEPTSAREFPDVVSLIGRVMAEFRLTGRIKLVVISNGSLVGRPRVDAGLGRLAALGGELWFKFDRATRTGMRLINDTALSPERHYAQLRRAAGLCPTWLQTCVFSLDGEPPSETEVEAYLEMLRRCRREGVPLEGIMLYGLARPSLQPEAPRLGPIPPAWLDGFAARVRAASGLPVRVTI